MMLSESYTRKGARHNLKELSAAKSLSGAFARRSTCSAAVARQEALHQNLAELIRAVCMVTSRYSDVNTGGRSRNPLTALADS